MNDTTPEFTLRVDSDVELVQHLASDEWVSRSARVSTLGGAAAGRTAADDAGLIDHLMRNRHGSPFEHGMFTWKISTPIFVWREIMRHRIASYNEESARYRELAPVFYMPGAGRPLVQVGKPGRYQFVLGDEDDYVCVIESAEAAYRSAWVAYQTMLRKGVAREVARTVLPVGTYSTGFVTMNPRGFMNFLSLRTKHEGAAFESFPQWEIERVADQMEAAFRDHMPVTWEAFRRNGSVCP